MTSMDRLKQEKNRGYVIAAGAAIIAFIAFFLPYVTVSGSYINVGSISVNGATTGSWLWFEFLGLLIVGAVSALFLFRDNLLSGTISMPLDKQIKYGKYLLLGASILALLVHLLFLLTYSAYMSGYASLVRVDLGFGFWVFLLAAIAMTVGSALVLRKSAPAVAQPYGQQYPMQSTQYPPQPGQYPPYQQSYQQTQQPQQPYPSYPQQPQQPQQPYQPYPSQQYPPTEQAQQPYSQPQQSQQPYQSYPQQPYSQPQQPYPQTGQPQQYPPMEMPQPPQQP